MANNLLWSIGGVAELRLRFADTDRVRILRPKTLRVAENTANAVEPRTVHADDVAVPDMQPYVAVGCEQTDSRVVWAEVTDAILAEDWTRAKTAKRAVEVRALTRVHDPLWPSHRRLICACV
jgi:hypothetical protein